MYLLPKRFFQREAGQALLLVLLVLSLVLTLVLSSVSKSVTDVEISKYEDNAVRAFDAAQAGIEKAVIGGVVSGTTVSLTNEASYTPIVTTNTNTGNNFKYPLELLTGESAYISFITYKVDSNGDYVFTCPSNSCSGNIPNQLRICWGKDNTPSNTDATPAIYMEYYYTSDSVTTSKFEDMVNLSDIKVMVATADPNAARRAINHFSAPVTTGGLPCTFGTEFSTIHDSGTANSPLNLINATGGSLLYMKVTMLYGTGSHQLGVRCASPLPSQGSIITSTGQSGDVFRRLVLFQGYPEIPHEFGNAIFSKMSLIK